MIKVLVVDDLFFMRTLISDLLNSDPEIRVIGTAKDGKDALAKIPRLRPDVITLDLSMPEMDGLTALQEIMNRYPTPVVILSAHESRKEADIVLKCLNSGAVSFVFKPSKELSLDIEDVKHQLLQEIKAVAAVDVKKLVAQDFSPANQHVAQDFSPANQHVAQDFSPATSIGRSKDLRYKSVEQRVVVIGASTGGPQTLETILSALPRIFPATVIVAQHVPGLFFSQSLAKRLNGRCHLNVKVAEDGEVVQTGEVYLVPFGFRMEVAQGNVAQGFSPAKKPAGLKACATKNERHFALHHSSLDETPSIDETMSSLSRIYRKNVLGIILTGIGSDGVEGMRAIRQGGGRTIAQDGSALINGMPLAVIEAGLADEVLSLTEISEAIVKFGEEWPI